MSKQDQANTIYKEGMNQMMTRQQIIDEIFCQIGCSTGYASTLFNNARKAYQADQSKKAQDVIAERNFKKPGELEQFATQKINHFDKDNLDQVNKELQAAVDNVLNKFGLSGSLGKALYKSHEFTTRLTVNTGNKDEATRNSFNDVCRLYGLTPDDFGRVFNVNGRVFTISGIKPSRRKYPINGVSPSGGKYKFTTSQVTRGLE